MVTVGASRSASTENRLAAALPLPLAPTATLAGTSTVTVPVAAGSIQTRDAGVAVDAELLMPNTLPLRTVTSADSNPVTDSEKVIVTMNVPV